MTTLVLVAAIVTMTLTQRPLLVLVQAEAGSKLLRLRPMVVLLPQLLGMAAGIGLVHALFTDVPDSSFGEARSLWLDDAVTSIGTLMSIWACAAAKLRFSVLVTMLVGLLGYGLVTPSRASCILSAQAMVAARVVAIATGLLAFRRFGAK